MSSHPTASDDLLDPKRLAHLRAAALTAGTAVLKVRESGRLDVRQKADGSPVTRADEAANESILADLSRLYPGVPVVSEESPVPELDVDAPFFLVDPVDGTKNFIKGGDEFTVNIGLIENRTPTAGVILAPATRRCYWTNEIGAASFELWDEEFSKSTLRFLEPVPDERLRHTALVSKSFLNQPTINWLEERHIYEVESVGSSLKLALLADGRAACYPRLSPIWEWDTAAGHAILNAVGGAVLDATGESLLRYGKPDFLSDGFLAFASGVTPDAFTNPQTERVHPCPS